mgnify:CR=1 FL=1
MGLDQYAAVRLDTKDEEGNWDTEEMAYWRKHPNLQGFMENLWEEKGRPNFATDQEDNPFGSDFNCVDLELTLEDIDALEAAIKGDELPETSGFFFGEDSSDHYKESDLEFCANARKALADRQTVVYSSSW